MRAWLVVLWMAGCAEAAPGEVTPATVARDAGSTPIDLARPLDPQLACALGQAMESSLVVLSSPGEARGVPLTPVHGFQRLFVDQPGTIMVRSSDFRPWLGVFQDGVKLFAARGADGEGGVHLVATTIPQGPYDVVVSSAENVARCPEAVSEGTYDFVLQ